MATIPPQFTIVSCVKSRAELQSIEHAAVVRDFLPSLVKTVTLEERRAWRISLYLCADDTDQFYVSQAAALRNASATIAPWLTLRLLFYTATRNRVPNREAALQAYADGAEYLHRTNDDISFMSSHWLTDAVTALRSLNPPNVGVVGPKVYGDGIRGGATTLDVVHRTHLDIFHDYYPPQLDNWFVDDWIAFTYTRGRKRRTFVLAGHKRFPSLFWRVQHVFTHGRRYKVAMAQKGLLPALIECGRDAVDGWINHTERAAAVCASGAAVPPPWPRVSCRAEAQLPTADRSALISGWPDAYTPVTAPDWGMSAVMSSSKRASTPNRTRAHHDAPPPEQVCRPRLEAIRPLENAGLYKQAAGYCAQLLPIDRGRCMAASSQ